MGSKPKVIAALDTPLTDDGERLAADRVAPLVTFLMERGVEGFFVAGSTGMGPLLAGHEWRELVRSVIEAAGSSLVLVNATAPTTRETVERVAAARELGASGVVVATPSAYRYELRAVLRYFEDALRAAEGAPTYLYRKMGDPWGAPELARLAEAHSNLRGVKDSATDMTAHLDLLRVEPLEVYQGYEALIASSVLAGGAGPVSGLATVLPEIVAAVTRAAATNAPHLWQEQERLTRVRALVCGTNPYAAFKALLARRGVPVGVPRRPFLPLADGELDRIVQGLAGFGIEIE